MEFPINLLIDRAVFFIPVLLSLTVHEWAHAWTALRLGDDTAKMLGRVSLNPLDHIDPVGTLLLPLLGVPFGWAKPVPINPIRFHSHVNMSMGVLLTAAAGPLSNVILAAASLAACFGLDFLEHSMLINGIEVRFIHSIRFLLQFLFQINLLLACFNLLPIPPLDGSRVVDAIMPTRLRSFWNEFSAMGPVFLLIILLFPFLFGFTNLSWPLEVANRLLP